MLVTHRPAAPLAQHVEAIWWASRPALPHRRELSLPTGRADIVIPMLQDSVVRFASVESREARHLRGAVVSDVHDRHAVRGMGGASQVMGVHFRPGGAAAIFGGALCELRNRTELLEALWGAAARDLHERLLSTQALPRKFEIVEAALWSRLRAAPPADPMVAFALRRFDQEPATTRIDALQEASNCSPQQFIRCFTAHVGLTPKRYARVLRFNALLPLINRSEAGRRDWAELAALGGYFDQSHLIHEFKRLAGMTPTAYAPLHASQPTHVPIVDAARAAPARKNLQYTGHAGA